MEESTDSGLGEESEAHRFRFPALGVAAAEVEAQQRRAMRGPMGCLFVLAGSAVIVGHVLDFGGRAVLAGLASVILSVLLRRGLGMVVGCVAAIGAGVVIAGTLLLVGTEAPWAYWTAAAILTVVGFSLAGTGSDAWPGFAQARRQSAHAGCRIGFFRPFRKDFSALAKNLLLPLLRGYGTVFFVTDESFGESAFEGLWSKGYRALPGLVGGHRYTHYEWRGRVQAAIEEIDVAVVDISVPSVSVVWEIKQCYDRLPSHRIILVASAAVLPNGIPSHAGDQDFQVAIQQHIEPVLRGLIELGANPATKPLCLIYSPEVEGQVWLANALFHAMSNIVALETAGRRPGDDTPDS